MNFKHCSIVRVCLELVDHSPQWKMGLMLGLLRQQWETPFTFSSFLRSFEQHQGQNLVKNNNEALLSIILSLIWKMKSRKAHMCVPKFKPLLYTADITWMPVCSHSLEVKVKVYLPENNAKRVSFVFSFL